MTKSSSVINWGVTDNLTLLWTNKLRAISRPAKERQGIYIEFSLYWNEKSWCELEGKSVGIQGGNTFIYYYL